jgi:hypothetical protein
MKEQAMYDTTKLSDAIDAVKDLKVAQDYLTAAYEILNRIEMLNSQDRDNLNWILTNVRDEVQYRTEQLVALD